jgi:hypothetical protein
MIQRLASSSLAGVLLTCILVACSSPTDSRSQGGNLGTDAGTGGSGGAGATANGGVSSQNGGASNGGRAGGSGTGGSSGSGDGGRGAGGSASTGGSAGAGGSAGSNGGAQNTGGSTSTGGAATDGGPCNNCLPKYDLHWGPNGGLVQYIDVSRLGPCANYSHERTPTFTDPPSLICNVTISMCPGSPLAQIIEIMGTPEFNAALTGHTLYGSDPRPVDGQVFRIGIGNDFIDVGPNCESDPANCPSMPEPIGRLVTLLRNLDTAMLAAEPCKSVFGN